MGLSILLPVLLSVVLTLIIVLIIRDFDKKSSSFNNACRKIKNYSLKISNDLAEMCSERIENVDSKCGELDISLARGEGLINKLKDNLDNFGSELESIEKVKSEVSEYSEKLNTMGEQIGHLEEVLNGVQASEEYLKNISTDLENFQKNVAIAKCDLDNLNNRLDRLENIYKKQNEASLENIKQKVIQNFESEAQNIIDNLNNYKDSLNESYTEINERLQEEKERLSEYLAHIIEKSDETHSSFEAKINEFSTNISQNLNLLYEEHQNKLASFEKSFEDIENRIVNIIQNEGAKKIQDLNTYFNSSWEDTKDKLQQHKDDVIQSIEKHYAAGRIDAQKMLQELRSVETRVSERMLELSDFDSKIQQKSDQFELYLEKSAREKIEKFHNGLKEIEADVELMETSILASLREKYEKFDSKVIDELNKLGLRIGEKVNSQMGELSGIENKVFELKETMNFIESDVMKTAGKLNAMSLDLRNSLYEKIEAISTDVDGRIKSMNAFYEDERKALIKTMENSLESLDSESREKVYNLRNRIQEIYSGVKSRLNNAENEIQRKTETIKRKFDQKIELIDEQIKQKEHKANTLIMEKLSGYFRNADEKSKEFENSLQEYHNDIFLLKDRFRKKCEDLTSWFVETIKVFAGENDIAGKKYREEIKLLEADNFNLREKMLTENAQHIQSLNEQFKRIEDELPAINEKVRLNSENISRITDEQILQMQKNVQAEVFLIKQKMSEQSAAIDEKLVQKMRDVNEVINVIQNMISQYNSKLNDFDSQKAVIIENLENEVNELKASYKERGEEFIKSSEKRAETIKESIHLLKEKADSINEDLALTVDSKILRSKNDFERIYSGIKESGKKELEDLINAKTSFMEELENRIAVLSNNSKLSLIKILKVAQKNINEVRDNAGKDISERCRELEEGAISSLETYRTELNDLKASLENLGSQVGPEVLDRIRESENALSDRLEAMGAECDVFLREIENNFSEKRSEELREYSENIEQLKEEMRFASEQLKVRVGDEIRAAKEAVSVELSAEAAKQLAEYESKLSGRYEELTEVFQKELSIYRETLNKLSVSSEERIAEVSAKYDESTAAEYRKYAVKLKEYSHQLTAVEEELERLKAEAEGDLREQKRAVSGYAEEAALKYEALSSDLSGEFNRLSVEIRREASELNSGALKQNELLEELSADYGKLSGELEKCSENLAKYRESMREAGAELRAEYGKLFAEQSSATELRLNAINEEISAKVEAGVKDAVVELNEKIADKLGELTDEKLRIESEVWTSLSEYDAKLKTFAEEASSAEKVYEKRLEEYAGKLFAEQKSLEDLSAEHVGALESQYEKLSDEISAYKIQMYSEIDERTRRGLSLLEEGVIEKLAELSKKEAASRELLEAESRSYTLLLEEVYAKTLTEQDNFEAKIRTSLKEVRESLNLAREAGAEESEKVLCEYKKLHEKAHELEIQLENRNEQLKESLEETLSLCVSKLSGRYAQAENAAEELSRSFGESLKEQTEAAREEIQSGRNALEEIRGKIEALKAEGVADYGELRSRYEEIELSLKEVKESQEIRLKALAEEAGAAAREELAAAAEELYALYEKTSAEAAKRYGESVRESETLKQIIENIQEESESLKKRSELSFNDFVLQTENEIKQLKSKLAEEHEALSEMSRADYEKLCRAHEESLREARAETTAKLKELSVKASEELRESLREAAAASEEIRALKAKYAADLAEQKTAHEDYSENLKALNEAHEKETAKLSKDLALFENKLSELNLNYSMNLEVCTMSARREIERALNAGCERLSDGISEARAELNSLLQKNNADYESIRSLYDALENELRKMFEAGEYERKEQALARLGELRNELARQAEANESKLAEVEKYYTEELSKQFARRSSELDALEMRLAELGSELTAKDAKFALSYEELNGELTTYRTELNDLKASLENLGSQVGPEVLDRIRESENALSDRLEAMGAECDVFLREIESNFSEKRSEELREYSENIEQLKEEMRLASEQLKVRVGDEIRAAKEAVSVELSAEAAKQLAEYESKLSGRYEELTEVFQKELSIYRETLNKLSVSSEERIAEVSAKYDESTAAEYRKYAVKLKEYSQQLTAVEEELERLKAEAESSLREQKRAVSGYAEEAALKYEALSSNLSGEFNRLSVEIRREAQSLTSGALKQNELLEELSEDYGKLSSELEKCSENLARYRESMREAGAELRAEYGKLFAEQSEAAQARLNAINEEISAKVEAGVKDAVIELNEKIAEQAAERLNEITELVQQRINEIQSAEHTCEKELKIRIDSYTEEMNKMQLHCSELEMQYENAVRDGLRKADNLIEEKLTSMRDYIAKEKSIIGTAAIEQINTNGMKLDDLVNKAKEYQSAYEDLAVKMEQLESDVTGKVNVYLEQFAARMNEPVADAKRELADILARVESLKDVIESKTRLMADEILKELDDKTEQIAGAAQLHSVEAEAKINELFAQVENHLENCRTTVQTQTEKLQKLEAAYQAQLSRKLGETDEAVEKELNNLHKAFLTASEKLSKETANLHREYEERERDLFASAQDSIEEMENKIVGLDSRIEAVGNEIGGKLEKQFAAAQEKMSNFTERQEKLYQTKIAELQKQFKAELESTQFTCSSKLAEMQTDIDNRTQDVYMKLNKIYDNFSVDAMKFDNENRERYRALLEKMEAAAEKVDTLKEELSMGMEERVKREFEMADELFVGKTQEMKENILRMEAENEKQLNDYRSELVRVQDALKVIEDDYSQMMKNKLAVLDEQAAHQLADIKSALSESVAVINFKMSELSDKMKSVENSYAEKAEFMLFNQEQKWKEIEDKYSNFDEHVNAVYRRLPNAAKEMDEVIAIGKAKLEDTVYSQIAQQKQHFQEVEMQLDAKALQLNKKMQEMQRSIRDVDSRFAAQYLERSGVLDERIASIEFEISKFERNIMLVQKTGEMKDELEKEICILKDTVAEVKADKNKMEVLGERMAELERTANERYEKLFAESQSYEDLNARIKDLQQEIESAEDKTQDLRDMRLATQQLDAKFIALERQFGRLDSMIGKIETSEAIAKDYSQKLNEMRSNVFELRQMMNTLESQWQEMEVKRKVYGEKMEHFESEADLILNSQSQINAVMTKFKQMDLLVEDLESRTGAVRHLQDWLIRAETRMENMKNDLQRVLPDEKIDVAESSGNLGESIRQLHRQGMSVEDIAKIVGTSREEVEFALELEDVLTSKR